jgi:DNA mismatch repair protein MutS2
MQEMTSNKTKGKAKKEPVPDEIDLHRMTVDEAVPVIEEFIYKAYQAGHSRVWIVHGKGTGVLKQEVRRYLSKHSLVKAQRTANSDRGGVGATQVDLGD